MRKKKVEIFEILSRFAGIWCNFWCHQFAIATSTRIEVCSVLVSHLATRFTTTILSALNKASIPINTDNSVVQTSTVYVPHRVLSIHSQVVFDETEAARSLFEFIQAHDDASDLTAT